MAQIWDYGRPFMPRRRSKRAFTAITSVVAVTALLMGLMPAAFASTSVDLTVTIDNKVYDGSASATILLCSVTTTLASGDTLDCDLTGVAASFDNENVGTGKTVTLNQNPGLTPGGSNSETYTVGNVSVGTANITVKTLNVTLTADNKTYDGTTAATGTLDDDRVSGDAVTLTSTKTFADKNVGIDKTVTASSIAISGGADSGNYTLGNTSDTDTADITARTLVVSLTADNKVYDGTTAAVGALSDDGVGGDDIGATATSITFADAAVGNGKTVTASGLAMTGAEIANYTLNGVTEVTDTADITEPVNTVVYTGTTYFVTSTTAAIPLAATFSSDSDVCLLDDSGSIEFVVEGLSGAVASSPFAGTAATATTATATTGSLPTGIYTVDVMYTSTDSSCDPTSDSAVVTIVTAGGSTNGGGWYRRADYDGDGSSRANFGFVLNKTYTGTGKNKTWSGYKGDFVWVSGEGWRIKAHLAGDTNYFGNFTCPTEVGAGTGAVCGSFQASGVLEYWDETALGGMGDWAYEDDVTFTVTVYDGGSVTICKRKACSKSEVADWFGIQVDGYSYSEVPETAPMALLAPSGKGSIKVLP